MQKGKTCDITHFCNLPSTRDWAKERMNHLTTFFSLMLGSQIKISLCCLSQQVCKNNFVHLHVYIFPLLSILSMLHVLLLLFPSLPLEACLIPCPLLPGKLGKEGQGNMCCVFSGTLCLLSSSFLSVLEGQ